MSLVTSVAQIRSLVDAQGRPMVRNFNQTRYESGSGQTTYNGGKAHVAVDIALPPGSPIYAHADGIWDHWGTSNEDGSTSMGWVGVMYAPGDRHTWRYIHIANEGRDSSLRKGQFVPAGTRLGTTSFHKLGQSVSHLHLDASPGTKYVAAQRIEPIAVLGVRGWNTMTTGQPGTSVGAIVGKILLASIVGGATYMAWAKFMRGRNPMDPHRLAP